LPEGTWHGGKLTIEAANVFVDEEYARAVPELAPGPYVVICVTSGAEQRPRHAKFLPAGIESYMPSQTLRLSTLLRALDRAAFLGARDREAVRAGDMGKGLALI
jgi:hypothetical protein